MILFIILLSIILLLTMFTIAIVSIGGSIFIIVFGDVIVCAVLLIWLIKKMFFNKKK